MSADLAICPFVFLLKLFLTLEAFVNLRFESLTVGVLLGVLSSTITIIIWTKKCLISPAIWLAGGGAVVAPPGGGIKAAWSRDGVTLTHCGS